jgi:hypothetical protein
MRLAIVSAVASAFIGFVCAAVPLSAVEAQPAKPVALANSIDPSLAQPFYGTFKPSAATDPAAATAGMAAAPAMIAAAGVPCTVTGARQIGVANKIVAVEAACSEGLGFVLVQNGPTVGVADCLSAQASATLNKNPALSCMLPANANPTAGLQPLLTRAKIACAPAKAVYLGETATALTYEVQCQSGSGALLQVDKPYRAASAARGAPCLALPRAAGAAFPCTLTTEEANLAVVKTLAAKATPPCTVDKTRYVAALSDGSQYYEVTCNGGAGLMVHASAAGDFAGALTCGQAINLAGGCTMTDAKASLAQALTDYSAKAKAAGFNCDVSKFNILPAPTGVTQAVDLACGSGDGGVLVIKSDKTVVFNCARSQPEGYACTLAPASTLPALTGQLKAMGKNTCTASGMRALASATFAYVEIACSDGAPGFLLRYARDSNTPANVYACFEAKDLGVPCALPTNVKPTAG